MMQKSIKNVTLCVRVQLPLVRLTSACSKGIGEGPKDLAMCYWVHQVGPECSGKLLLGKLAHGIE